MSLVVLKTKLKMRLSFPQVSRAPKPSSKALSRRPLSLVIMTNPTKCPKEKKIKAFGLSVASQKEG